MSNKLMEQYRAGLITEAQLNEASDSKAFTRVYDFFSHLTGNRGWVDLRKASNKSHVAGVYTAVKEGEVQNIVNKVKNSGVKNLIKDVDTEDLSRGNVGISVILKPGATLHDLVMFISKMHESAEEWYAKKNQVTEAIIINEAEVLLEDIKIDLKKSLINTKRSVDSLGYVLKQLQASNAPANKIKDYKDALLGMNKSVEYLENALKAYGKNDITTMTNYLAVSDSELRKINGLV